MFQDRKEYRKNFNSPGAICLGGETLDFMSYDVSVKGLLIEVQPGVLLSTIADFEALLQENKAAEVFVKELQLTGEVEIIWVHLKEGKIMLGLEFKDVQYNADKLWRKRRYYRSKKSFTGHLIVENKQIDFKGINTSVDGMALELANTDNDLRPGVMIKLKVDGLDSKGIAKIVWINITDKEDCTIGVRYLAVE